MPSSLGRILRFVLKLVLGLLAAVVVISLLTVALIVVLFSLIRSFITGRKSESAMVFSRFQKFSPKGIWPVASPAGAARKPSTADQVVDVEVREIRDDKRLP